MNSFHFIFFLQANKAFKKLDAEKKEQELMAMKAKYGLSTPGKDSGGGK